MIFLLVFIAKAFYFSSVIFKELLWILLKILYLRRLFEVDIDHEIYLVNGFLWYRFRSVVLDYIFCKNNDQ